LLIELAVNPTAVVPVTLVCLFPFSVFVAAIVADQPTSPGPGFPLVKIFNG
jgi:hypothetical protein